jgi:hypothetical protein
MGAMAPCDRPPQHKEEAMNAQSRSMSDTSVAASPVDDHTYNVLQALTSTLESIEAYETYQEDDDGELFGRLLEDERQHANLLLDELRTRIGRQGSASTMGA